MKSWLSNFEMCDRRWLIVCSTFESKTESAARVGEAVEENPQGQSITYINQKEQKEQRTERSKVGGGGGGGASKLAEQHNEARSLYPVWASPCTLHIQPQHVQARARGLTYNWLCSLYVAEAFAPFVNSLPDIGRLVVAPKVDAGNKRQ
jgi:hypothetical protein